MTTVTLTFHPKAFRWLLESAFRMLTKERGHDSLIFIINGTPTPFPNHPINYTVALANDITKLVEDYASIKVEAT